MIRSPLTILNISLLSLLPHRYTYRYYESTSHFTCSICVVAAGQSTFVVNEILLCSGSPSCLRFTITMAENKYGGYKSLPVAFCPWVDEKYYVVFFKAWGLRFIHGCRCGQPRRKCPHCRPNQIYLGGFGKDILTALNNNLPKLLIHLVVKPSTTQRKRGGFITY